MNFIFEFVAEASHLLISQETAGLGRSESRLPYKVETRQVRQVFLSFSSQRQFS